MKFKKYYLILFLVWSVSAFLQTISCLINFVSGKMLLGILFLILCVSFSFVSGVLLSQYGEACKQEKVCGMIDKFFKEKQEQPFKEFEKKEKEGENNAEEVNEHTPWN